MSVKIFWSFRVAQILPVPAGIPGHLTIPSLLQSWSLICLLSWTLPRAQGVFHGTMPSYSRLLFLPFLSVPISFNPFLHCPLHPSLPPTTQNSFPPSRHDAASSPPGCLMNCSASALWGESRCVYSDSNSSCWACIWDSGSMWGKKDVRVYHSYL